MTSRWHTPGVRSACRWRIPLAVMHIRGPSAAAACPPDWSATAPA
jgi:hypothetical protein